MVRLTEGAGHGGRGVGRWRGRRRPDRYGNRYGYGNGDGTGSGTRDRGGPGRPGRTGRRRRARARDRERDRKREHRQPHRVPLLLPGAVNDADRRRPVSGTFAIFLGSAYWEEFWDGDNAGSLAPKDLAKVTLWMLALYVVRALSILVWRRYGALRRAAAESTTDPHVPSAGSPRAESTRRASTSPPATGSTTSRSSTGCSTAPTSGTPPRPARPCCAPSWPTDHRALRSRRLRRPPTAPRARFGSPAHHRITSHITSRITLRRPPRPGRACGRAPAPSSPRPATAAPAGCCGRR